MSAAKAKSVRLLACPVSWRAAGCGGWGRQGAPDGRAKGDFGGIKSREKLDGLWGGRVVGVADAGEQAKKSGVEVSAQDSEFPQHSLQTRREDSV